MMKILFLSSSDNNGGAAKATFKLYKSLLRAGLNMQMFVKKKQTSDSSVHKIFTMLPMSGHIAFDNFVLNRYNGGKRNFWSLSMLPNLSLYFKMKWTSYDIVQLNWISAGFVPIRLLSIIRKPIVWRLSDSWAFTGGCHIPDNCVRYTSGCGACPQLNSSDVNDISHRTITRKLQYWKDANITLVAPSKWMAENARKSLVFKNRNIVHIPTGVNVDTFKPLDRTEIRNELGIAAGKRVVLFGAVDAVADPNKGFHLLLEALSILYSRYKNPDEIQLIVFGHGDKIGPQLTVRFHATFVGMVGDPAILNKYYNAADVYVLPSIMENSPNTVVEAMAAGTPVVGFGACGTTELIEHLKDGYLARPYLTEDLAKGIEYFLLDKANANQFRIAAREKVVSRYNIDDVASKYQELYKTLN